MTFEYACLLASLLLSLGGMSLATYLYLSFRRQRRLGARELNDLLQTSTLHLISRVRRAESLALEASTKLEESISRIEAQLPPEDLADSVKTLMKAQLTFLRGLRRVQERLARVEASVRGLKAPRRRQPFAVRPPPRREISLARLNPTEMEVLRLLYVSGPKTASEIKEVIGRTREHTARLMKKLYEEGYVERSMETMPFTYKLSERIRKSLEFSVRKEKPEG